MTDAVFGVGSHVITVWIGVNYVHIALVGCSEYRAAKRFPVAGTGRNNKTMSAAGHYSLFPPVASAFSEPVAVIQETVFALNLFAHQIFVQAFRYSFVPFRESPVGFGQYSGDNPGGRQIITVDNRDHVIIVFHASTAAMDILPLKSKSRFSVKLIPHFRRYLPSQKGNSR